MSKVLQGQIRLVPLEVAPLLLVRNLTYLRQALEMVE